MKSATKRLLRIVVDVARRADLQHVAAAHHRDAVGHGERLLLVVRDQHEGDAGLALQPLQLALHLLAQLEIERRQRLVEQQHARLRRQRARQRDALLLAARQVARAARGEAVEPHHLERFGDALVGSAVSAPFSISSPNATLSATVICGNSA